MREWVPVSSSVRGRLVASALHLFGERPFDDVSVTELSAAAGATTGALYHHFGSKAGLFDFVYADVAQRVVDRILGATGVTADIEGRTVAALLAAFDFATTHHFTSLLSGTPPGNDAVARAFGESVANQTIGTLLAAVWRAAVLTTTHGTSIADARAAITALRFVPS